MTELRRTYLVQRLKKPYKGNADNPFNFGGGPPRGGMNEEGYRATTEEKLIIALSQWDYLTTDWGVKKK